MAGFGYVDFISESCHFKGRRFVKTMSLLPICKDRKVFHGFDRAIFHASIPCGLQGDQQGISIHEFKHDIQIIPFTHKI